MHAMLVAISATAFLFYGAACLFAKPLVAEFERYRLPQFRVLVGLLEIAGASGLLAGQFVPALEAAAAAGLALLMACGLWARWRIRDPWHLLVPAFALGVLNAFLFVHALRRVMGS